MKAHPAGNGQRVTHPPFPPGPPPSRPPHEAAHQPPHQAPQPAPPQPPGGWVALTIQGSVMTGGFIPPRITFNGYPVHASYGQTMIPVTPGRVRVEASQQWLRTYGQAECEVQVVPGQVVPVYYAGPWHQFSRGAMGTTPQKRPGTAVGVATLLVVVLSVVLAIVGLALAAGLLAST